MGMIKILHRSNHSGNAKINSHNQIILSKNVQQSERKMSSTEHTIFFDFFFLLPLALFLSGAKILGELFISTFVNRSHIFHFAPDSQLNASI